MSENIPESIPTSADPRSHRALKKRALSPTSKQAAHLDSLFAHPEKQITLPQSNSLTKTHPGAAPPEIVANVQGSSAGAGSGEFHVYKASRRREYERLRVMEEEKTKEEEDALFEARLEEVRNKDDEKTAKNRAKREKARLRGMKKKGAGAETGEGEKMEGGFGPNVANGAQKAKFKPNVAAAGQGMVERENGTNAPAVAQEEPGIIIHDED